MTNEKPDDVNREVLAYDTTLRDGAQAVGVTFSAEDKLRVVEVLAGELGVHYVEAGWPGSNPTDDEVFDRLGELELGRTKVVAFGSTRGKGRACEDDRLLTALVRAPVEDVALVGKTWTLHVTSALGTTLEENLAIISESVEFLVGRGKTVHFDAEHFFDGVRADRDYAFKCLAAALDAGAHSLVLCDTNGATLPGAIGRVVADVADAFPEALLGIHAHDDSGVAVANSLAAFEAGSTVVQGTVNGIGERCGNANLLTVLANLHLKLGVRVLPDGCLRNLTDVAKRVNAQLNLPPPATAPYVGTCAFTHKGGLHVSGIARDAATYEHVDPQLVGNERDVAVSELSGRSTILFKARQLGFAFDDDSPKVDRILQVVKERQRDGYSFEGAEGSLELIIRSIDMNIDDPQFFRNKYFRIEGFRVHSSNIETYGTEATIRVVVRGKTFHTAAEGNGPVNAIDNALRKALEHFYPSLRDIELTDFKVRIIKQAGTASKVQVFARTRDGDRAWGTVGAHENIIIASWEALLDAYVYKLLKDNVAWAERGYR
ncbi:MAG: citramalate synthase [Promethearchaeota archaeon]